MHSIRSSGLKRLLSSTIALTASIASFLPYSQKAEANPATVPVITACLSNPYCAIAVVTVGGLAYWELNQDGQKRWIPLAPIIDDPDREPHREWDYIFADSEQEAIRKCQAFAEGNRVRYVKVKKVGRGKRYECHWEF